MFKEVLAQLGAAPCLQNQPQQKISESGPPVSGPPVKSDGHRESWVAPEGNLVLRRSSDAKQLGCLWGEPGKQTDHEIVVTSLARACIGEMALSGVEQLAFRNKRYCGCCCGSGGHDVPAVKRKYNAYPDDKLACCGVARVDGNIAGFVQMQLTGMPGQAGLPQFAWHSPQPDEAYVEMVAVLPSVRGVSIGRDLLQWAEETARAKGKQRLVLNVISGNPAQRLYERLGFEEVPSASCRETCIDWVFMPIFLGCPYGKVGSKDMKKVLI